MTRDEFIENVEDKMKDIYQQIRNIFGDNATIFISVHGDSASTRINYN